MTLHVFKVPGRLVLQSAAIAAFLFSGAAWGQGWPPGMTGQDFEKMQRFFRALDEGMKPAAGPVAEELIYDPETRDLSLAEIAGIEKALPRLFFLEPEASGRTAVKSPLFVLPNADHIQMQVQWTSALNAQKKNVLRKATAAESEEDRSFQRSERITNGEYTAVLRTQNNEPAVRASGTADVSIPLRFFRAEFDCAKPGSAKAGPHEFTLVRCENDYAEIRQKTTDRTPLDVDIRLYGLNGRLKVSQQSTDAVFPGGRTIVDLTFKDRPDKIEGRRFRALAHGLVRRIVVLLPAQAAKKKLQVQALAEPARDSSSAPNRYGHSVPLPELSVTLPEAAIRGVQAESTRSYAYFGFNEPGVLFPLPPHPGRDYAVCEFARLDLVDENGESVAFETSFAGYDRERKGCHVRFQTETGEVPAFSRARGMLKLRYPLSFSSYITDGRTSIPGVRIRIEGMKVTVETDQSSTETSLLGLAALNGRLYPLRPLSNVQTAADGRRRGEHLFWGSVEKVWFVMTGGWTEMEKSFDLQPAAPLSEADRGKTNVHRNH